MISLGFVINLLSELDFFKQLEVDIYFPLFLSFLNSFDLIFEMFPFIFLITTQLFFIKLFENKEIEIFKYSGLKNTKILTILSIISFITSLLIVTLFYNLSSNLKNIYLELKSNYTYDGKYLAMVTKNGLWIKDKVEDKILLINSQKIEKYYLINNFITEFDENFNVIRNIQNKKIDISKNEWRLFDPKIFEKNVYQNKKEMTLNTNFNFERIQTLYSNLSSLNIFELYELRQNYKSLNYSLTEIDLQLLKLISYPVYLVLMTIFSGLIMFNIKNINSSTFKVSLGLFFSVLIYYFSNFFHVLGSTERISLIIAIFTPLFLLSIINGLMLYKVNNK
tara:strand:+ start:2556 stop:3563 length:1008 start_codon:yes stop_codon:yes gene_type:complete